LFLLIFYGYLRLSSKTKRHAENNMPDIKIKADVVKPCLAKGCAKEKLHSYENLLSLSASFPQK